MMNVGLGFLRGEYRCTQNWRLSQSVNQSQESSAERRARAAAFPSKFDSAQPHIQIEPLCDREAISTSSQPISRAAEINFKQTDFMKILKQKCFKPLRAERFLGGESLKSKGMVQRANWQRCVR